MKNILILGASGMAGHIIYTYLKENTDYAIVGTTNKTRFNDSTLSLDIHNTTAVEDLIVSQKPDIVINCIGILIKESKTNPSNTVYCNAYFPHFLKQVTNSVGAKLIHISTDCVFSGKTGGYTENSFKDVTDVYGLSKSLGEIIDNKNLTIRTSIIGPELKIDGEGLFNWFMNQDGEVSGYKSSFWSGVTTLELAKFIAWVIKNPITGLYHLTNNTPISKFELLNLFKKVHQKNLDINSNVDYKCDKSFINTLHPNYYKVPTYLVMLEQQKGFMLEHQKLYKSYNI